MEIGKNKRGITLIELLIVMSIIGIMTSVTIIAMGGGKAKEELEIEARKTASVIREAQSYSLTGMNTKKGCGSYVVDFPNNKTIRLMQSGTCSNPINKSYSLNNEVSFSDTAIEINFSVPHGGISLVGSGFPLEVVLEKNGEQCRVCVTEAGKIEVQESGGC